MVRGSGPFVSKSKHVRWSLNHYLPPPRNDTEFPFHLYENMHDPFRGMRFGAPTKSAMKEWINEPRVLRSHKYVVRKYKVPVDKLVASQIQCVFKKRDAQCVAEYDIVEFMKGKKK